MNSTVLCGDLFNLIHLVVTTKGANEDENLKLYLLQSIPNLGGIVVRDLGTATYKLQKDRATKVLT